LKSSSTAATKFFECVLRFSAKKTDTETVMKMTAMMTVMMTNNNNNSEMKEQKIQNLKEQKAEDVTITRHVQSVYARCHNSNNM
jgi:uncharacterized protein YjdB